MDICATTQWELMEEEDEGDDGILQPSSEQPQSVNGVRCIGSSKPPPFLSKIFEIVEDPKTNSIISWNSTGTSFIVWEHLRFAKEIQPKYFKSDNFSSFIYQLNNYVSFIFRDLFSFHISCI